MQSESTHLSDQDLLLAVDGELPESRVQHVTGHLAACWDCRSRRLQLEATIANFVEARHELLDPQLPPETRSRALLKVQLLELASRSSSNFWTKFAFRFGQPKMVAAGLAAALVLSTALVVVYRPLPPSAPSIDEVALLEPSRQLTPGAVRPVNLTEICGGPEEEDAVRVVPASLQQQVFQEYGIKGARPRDYEVDFLITPELGGSNDIHNLWPEPYFSTVWNAHVKDELEDLLRAKVCDGEVDLSTAQRDISYDWIAAYKKYFHTDKPL